MLRNILNKLIGKHFFCIHSMYLSNIAMGLIKLESEIDLSGDIIVRLPDEFMIGDKLHFINLDHPKTFLIRL